MGHNGFTRIVSVEVVSNQSPAHKVYAHCELPCRTDAQFFFQFPAWEFGFKHLRLRPQQDASMPIHISRVSNAFGQVTEP